MEFEKRKASTLSSLGASETDKSPKGSLDTPIIPLLNAINLHPNYYTTSSCSGRVSILSTPTSSTVQKKARGGSWIYITHDFADKDAVLDVLFRIEDDASTQQCDVVFRFEPLIIAVECRDVASAQKLVSVAVAAGFRESGISNVQKRVMVGIRCSIRMEVPLGEKGRILASREYVGFLVEVANQKMETNRKRTDGFFQALLGNGFGGVGVGESKHCAEIGEVIDSVVAVGSESHFHRSVHDRDEGSLRATDHLAIDPMTIIGESRERLFLWGHTACTMDDQKKVLVYGGFGGMGRHARRIDSLQLDPLGGALEVVKVENPPPARLGHTACMVGKRMFVIAGRADPMNILNDVWVLDMIRNEWKQLKCSGCPFAPRHRHAAAAVGLKIYVFGGLNNDTVLSSLHVLDTVNLEWSEISCSTDFPTARHSHAMVATESHLFIFGGCGVDKVLGDLYSFDVRTQTWQKEQIAGKVPRSRFSHSMFVHKHYIGVMGGCPINKTCKEIAFVDLKLRMWKHIPLNSAGNDLFVRSTANIVGDNLVIIGGGAACYAFGTKFSEPIIINLLPILSVTGTISGNGKAHNCEIEKPCAAGSSGVRSDELAGVVPKTHGLSVASESGASHSFLLLEKDSAKVGKDLLKRHGWLDLTRKAFSGEDGKHICFPVTIKFCSLFHAEQSVSACKPNWLDGQSLNSLGKNGTVSIDAILTLTKLGAQVITNNAGELRKTSSSPLKVMREAILSLLKRNDLSEDLLEQLPARWERLGDIVVLPVTSFKDEIWDSLGDELWSTVAKSLGARRLARQGRVASTGTRDSNLEILVGENGWVEHRENGIVYSFDATKCMFSWGNLSEKLRMARMDCRDEIIVDLFAGIGYFVLPFLVRANAKQMYACEWNPNAIEALRRNLQANSVTEKCVVLEGDNRLTAPKGIANRVNLGLLPTSELSWETAVRALRSDGGMLHVHANVKDSEEGAWTTYLKERIWDLAKSEGRSWDISIDHVEKVKWYAPHIRHLVADVRCTKKQE
ncbi:unnamed protein product [Rhodiola kirilowii]